MLKQLIEHVVKQLVNKPNLIKITDTIDGSKRVIEILVAPDDLKRVIGADGCVIRAIRAMANCIDPTQEKEVILDALSS